MHPIALRRLLPVLALLAVVVLLFLHALDRRVVASRATTLMRHPAASDPIIETHSLPLPVGVISVLALPGLLPLGLLGVSPASPALHSPIYLTGIAVITGVAWYLVGRWIDKRRGLLDYSTYPPRFYFLNWILLIMWIVAASTIAAVLVDIDFLGEMRWMAFGVIVWGAFVGVIFASRIRDSHREPSQQRVTN